ncbi:hypothetical protein L873DRAFT_1815133 [Choiromyces venosus 120613-1]|uniref:Uncharacterized protein n=1 Tax=Choiromyces venosus 120613-1 TaxID=1336337 RepID=A0A3N4J6U2_9PEZI|nr:hypothetical protein L873DRAFT_1815133 [Choiromyces venosus 120613-1]
MLAANKENDLIVHGPHMGKINAKTPGPSKLHPKTPFKIPLNDENAAGKTGKKALFVGKDPSLFVTPICPRGGPRRPALTGKTTNAKARRFTPPEEGSVEQQQKPIGSVSRLNGSKISITEDVRPVLHNEDGEYPEIEYMPPCPPELPDIPDDFMIPDYDKLSKSIYRDCHRQFLLDIDEFGKTSIERQLEESERQIDAMLDAETEELLKPLPLRIKDTSRPKKTAISVRPDASKAKHPVEKTATAKPTVTKRPTSRSTSRSASRPASALSTSSSVASGKTASTNTDTKSTALFSQRPASSLSNTRPKAPSRTASHSRSVSTSVINKPLSFSRSSKAIPPPPRPEGRTLRATNSKSTIGYTNGKEVGRKMKRVLTAGPKETAIEACERVLQEDEDDFSPIILPSLVADEGGDCEDPVIMPPVDDIEEEFYMQVPE